MNYPTDPEQPKPQDGEAKPPVIPELGAAAPTESAAPAVPAASSTDFAAQNKAEFERAFNTVERLKAEIGRVVIGQEDVIEQIIVVLLAGGHALLEGVPGVGKTLLVRALSQAVEAEFARVQFTPDLMPTDVTGHAMYDQREQEFVIRRGPVFCNFLLADEINRAPAKTQAALLEVMQEWQVTIEGESFQLDPPFMVLATQNPVEQEGTYPLPEAQLDRFLLKIDIGYPEATHEFDMVASVTTGHVGDALDVEDIEPVLNLNQVQELQRLASTVQVDRRVLEYAVEIVRATRSSTAITIGSGPRGSIAIIRAARALALIQGRDFVTPDDVKSVAEAALRHRVALSADLQMEGRTPDEVVAGLIERIPAPRL